MSFFIIILFIYLFYLIFIFIFFSLLCKQKYHLKLSNSVFFLKCAIWHAKLQAGSDYLYLFYLQLSMSGLVPKKLCHRLKFCKIDHQRVNDVFLTINRAIKYMYMVHKRVHTNLCAHKV